MLKIVEIEVNKKFIWKTLKCSFYEDQLTVCNLSHRLLEVRQYRIFLFWWLKEVHPQENQDTQLYFIFQVFFTKYYFVFYSTYG